MFPDDNECIYCDRDSKGLMICCERCDNWYHYRCVKTKWDLGSGLRTRNLQALVEYYCYPCRRANPSLKLKYFSPENFNGNYVEFCKTYNAKRNSNNDTTTTTATKKTTTRTTTKTKPTQHHHVQCTKLPPDYTEASQSSTTSSSSSTSSLDSSSSTTSSSSTSYSEPVPPQPTSARLPEFDSSNPESDDTVENKQPIRTKTHIPGQPVTESPSVSISVTSHQHQQNPQSQQQQNNSNNQQQQQQQLQIQPQHDSHPGPAIRTSDKNSQRGNKFKHKSSKLRTKVEKEWKRQRFPNL